MSAAVDYGRRFAGFYDRIFPPGEGAEQTADLLAGLHPGDGLPALELGVGTGRIALPLAERIGDVVGVDLSSDMLDVLRGRAPRSVTPVEADMRTYADDRRYGLVYCVCGTLSMVLEEQGQQQVLETCARQLAPGGTVVVETHNSAYVAAIHDGRPRDSFFVPYPGGDSGLLTYSNLDPQGRIWQLSHIWFEDGGAQVASETSRLTTPEEIDAYAERAGLRLEARLGDWAGAPFAGSEPTFICVYR